MAAQSKMFVHYKGTVAAFKEAGLESVYNNHIVFIKGGEADGKGEAVYTHGQYYGNVKDALAALQTKVDGMKYFSKISDGTTTASVASAEGTITIKGEDPAIVTLIDKEGLKIGLSDTFKTAVNTTLPNAIDAVEEALGSKEDAADVNGSAFARIANLTEIVSDLTGGSAESVGSQITNAINKLDVDAVAGDYVASISQVDGKIVPVMGDFAFDAEGSADAALASAKSYVDGKVDGKFDASGAAADALQGAKDYADGKDSAMDARVKVLEAIDHAKLASDAAASAVATVLDDAPEAFDTLKEVAEWIADNSHASDVATLVSDVASLKAIDHEAYKAADEANLAAAKGYTDSEIAKLSFDAAGTAASEAAGALASAKSYVDGKVDGKFDAKGSAAAAESAAKSYADSLAGNYATAAQGAKADAAAPQSTTYTKAEVDEMWAWEEL